jgi:hypothetical protein
MNRLLFILLLFLCACRPEGNVVEDNMAIFALWEVGEKPTIQAVLFNEQAYQNNPNQSFSMVFQDGETAGFFESGDRYELQSSRTPQAGERLTLYWIREGDTASVVVEMPPAITNIIVENDTLQQTNPNDECSIEWSVASVDVEFALRLQCLEENPQLLPWAPGTFQQLYSGPQIAAQLVLQPGSFSCMGTHQLTITVLNDPLINAFFFDSSDIRGLLKNGPDNVVGGKGFVSGISTQKILLEIE